MTEDENEYYVAELVHQAEQSEDVELSTEEREAVAELQQIHREVDLEDFVADEQQVAQLSTEQKNEMELMFAEFIRRGRNQSQEQREELYDYFGVDRERLAELSEGEN